MTTWTGTLRGLPPESRLVGGSAAALAVSLILPWYQKSYVPQGSREFIDKNLSALAVFSWVEAAVLLVAVGVLYLMWARAQRRAFHLPGGDGFVVSLAGGWALLLLAWRLFDKPNIEDPGGTIGIQWGLFAAMLAAGALIAAGARVRAAGRPEPPNPAADDAEWEVPEPRAPRTEARPRAHAAVTEVLRDRPAWQGDPLAPLKDDPDEPPPPPPPPPPAKKRSRREPPPPSERLF